MAKRFSYFIVLSQTTRVPSLPLTRHLTHRGSLEEELIFQVPSHRCYTHLREADEAPQTGRRHGSLAAVSGSDCQPAEAMGLAQTKAL